MLRIAVLNFFSNPKIWYKNIRLPSNIMYGTNVFVGSYSSYNGVVIVVVPHRSDRITS